MLPTYPPSGLTFVWCGAFWFEEPKIGDVIAARLDDDVAFLKRIVGVSGDRLQWIDGKLWRNGEKVHEPYVAFESDWQSEEIIVDAGYFYIVGDNRSMPFKEHIKGQLLKRRVIGAPLW